MLEAKLETKNNKLTALNYIAILSIFLFSSAGTFMNSAIQTMMDAWPTIAPSTIRLVVSIPPLVSLPVMLVIGKIVGDKIAYRTSAIVGTALIVFAGVAPYFFSSNWSIVLLFRALVGVGVGLLAIRNPLIMLSVPLEKQARYIGFGSVVMSLGSTIANPLVGALTEYSWRHPFLIDSLAIIPLVFMLFFLKEPAVSTVDIETPEEKKSSMADFTWRTYYYIFFQFIATATLYPLLSGMTTYMADKGVGTAALAGTILSSYTLSGMAISIFLSQILRLFKNKSLVFLSLLFAVGVSLVVLFPNIPMLFVGTILAGAGFIGIVSVLQIYNGRTLPTDSVAFGSTLILGMNQLAIFASNYFIVFSHSIFGRSTDIESTLIACVICYIILTVASFMLKVAPNNDSLEIA